MAVLEVPRAYPLELWRGGQQDRGRRALLGRLERDAGGAEALGGALHVLGAADVALQRSGDPARMRRVGGDPVAGPPPGRLDREQHVGGLGLPVCAERVVGAEAVVQVVEDDRGAQMAAGAHRDDPGAPGGRERVMEAERQREVPEVVGGELHLVAAIW